jgi:hypothetical protein
MSIILKPKDSSSENSSNRQKAQNQSSFSEMAFFIAINVLILPFSAYQTYVGYEADVAGNSLAALALAVISAILFAAMNVKIRDNRLKGKPIILQTVMYIVPLGISIPANFNAFYSNMTNNQIYDQGIAEYQTTFVQTINEANKKIIDCAGYESIEVKYNVYINNLESQFNGKAGQAQGWGDECKVQWDSIKYFLKANDPSGVGILNNPGTGSNAINKAKDISKELKDEIVKNKKEKIAPYLKFIDSISIPVLTHIKLVKENNSFKEEGKVLMDEIVMANNQIGSKVNSFTVDFCGDFKYTLLKPSQSNRSSTIEYSMQSAFIDMPSPSATFFSLFLASIIDFSALLYILFFIQGSKSKGGHLHSPKPLN